MSRAAREAFRRVFLATRGRTILTLGAVDKPHLGECRPLVFRKTPKNVQNIVLPLKNERLKELADAGFNCPDFKAWSRGGLVVQELREFWEKHGRISSRNFTEEKLLDPTPQLPVLYDQNDWNLILDFCREHNKKYHTLVNEALPLEDSVLAGNILLCDAKEYEIACFEGYGTPRFIEEGKAPELKVFRQKFDRKPPGWLPEELIELASRLRTFRDDFRPMIAEFSVYSYPVGIYKRTEILWEWRSGYAAT